MIRCVRSAILFASACLILVGCSNEEDESPPTVPYEPSQTLLDAGPEPGKSFLRWNAAGLQIAAAANYEASGTCYAGVEAEIGLPDMLGLRVPATALPQDSLVCTVEVTDTNYTQTEYLPEGIDWADSVTYWADTSVVQMPAGVMAQDVSFYWYNRHSGDMVEVNTVLDGAHWKAKTLHFSRYILGQKRSAH